MSWLASTARKKKPRPLRAYQHQRSPKQQQQSHPFVAPDAVQEDGSSSEEAEESEAEPTQTQPDTREADQDLDESYIPPAPPKVKPLNVELRWWAGGT